MQKMGLILNQKQILIAIKKMQKQRHNNLSILMLFVSLLMLTVCSKDSLKEVDFGGFSSLVP